MTTEEQIQRYKELLGLITQGEWQVSPGSVGHLKWKSATHSLRVIRKVGGYVCEAIHRPGSYRKEAEANAEFITLSRNLAQPLLDAWEKFDDYLFAQKFADADAQEAIQQLAAALEQVKALEAEVAKLQDLIRLRLVNDELFLYDHPDEETIFIREWTDDAQQALTPEPSPESATMTTEINFTDCRTEVQRFSVLMEQVLRKNDRKGGWKKMDDTDILRRIHQEVLELDQEVLRSSTKVDREAAIKEAVDVANFCMFLADIYGGLKP